MVGNVEYLLPVNFGKFCSAVEVNIKSQPETTVAISGFLSARKTQTWYNVHDLEYLFPIKFHQIWFCKLGLFVFPRGDAGGLSREYVLRIPSVS